MKKERLKNIVFLSEKVNIRAGGPSGYIANLKIGIEKCNYKKIKFIFRNGENKELKKINLFLRIMSFWIPIKSYRKKFRNYLKNKIPRMSFDNVSIDSVHFKDFVKELDKYEFETITCHHVRDALFIRNYLNYRNSNAKLILMSHSPEPPSEEIFTSEKAIGNQNAEKNYEKWKYIEQEAFYYAADILLFPSKESVEPYSQALEYFDEIKIKKPFLFLETGCCALNSKSSCNELRNKYNIKTNFVISYIGRHNRVKGYDLLKKIAEKILEIRDDVTFLIGGKQGNEIEALKNDKWIELGFVDPASVLKISDCFILPNRQTYFDLILLEVLSMGCPIFASNTGGNKAVYKRTNVIMLYNNEDECVKKIVEFLNLPQEEKEKLKERTQKAYNDYYTTDVFAKNYIGMIEQID